MEKWLVGLPFLAPLHLDLPLGARILCNPRPCVVWISDKSSKVALHGLLVNLK